MTSSIFETWFKDTFVPVVRKHLRSKGIEEKACLLLDNCPAHPPVDILRSADGKISVYYLPKNTTSKIQPLDQGIISSFKRHYRYELVRSLLAEDKDMVTFLKSLDLKDAFYLASDAWDAVKPASIAACWDQALGNSFDHDVAEEQEEQEEVEISTDAAEKLPIADGQTVQDFVQEWATIDDDQEVAGIRSEEDIVKDMVKEEDDEDDGEEGMDDKEAPELISHSKALEAAELLLAYFEQQGSRIRAQQIRSATIDVKKV